MIVYSKEDEEVVKKFRCYERALYANKRFTESITKFDVLSCLKRFKFRCAYCCVLLKASDWQLDHFYPRASFGRNTPDNICPTCKWCNTMKNALDGWSFINKCRNISANNLIEHITDPPDHFKDKVYVQNGFIQNEFKSKKQ
jgi:hypothetical protein